MLNSGDKILVVHRRIFENDRSRFFVGVVKEYESGIASVSGHSFSRNPQTTAVIKKMEMRTKIISLSCGTLMIYLLDSKLDLSKVHFENAESGDFLLKHADDVIMDLTEVPHE